MSLNASASRDILIQTEAPDAAAAFYEGVLGFRVFQRDPDMIGLEAGALRLFLHPRPAYGPVLEVMVDDLEAAKRDLVGAGCRIEDDDPAVPRCYVRDPYGLIFNVAQRKT